MTELRIVKTLVFRMGIPMWIRCVETRSLPAQFEKPFLIDPEPLSQFARWVNAHDGVIFGPFRFRLPPGSQ
ncbi:hypothetical protein SAMN06265222_10129 [Neorhodopirellula lusitana]|uniref:Uncharacterized protein n=1 Tax=Neorhodopirellula lusitana TaxID=445327 RepID=A0ABY1PMQ5_9BACT|nr:hypothetical protein SAMN06265222_10129 [Neorhodopirellula lusitana]